MKKRRKLLYIFLISLFSIQVFASFFLAVQAEDQGGGKLVYVIPVEKEVERGLEAFLRRTTNEAIEAGANHIIFEINTPGGRVDSAGEIATILQNLPMPSTSYIINQALSAGSYIALNTDNIYMAPHATMGSSQVIYSDGTAADDKAQSAWIAQMKEAATSKGRDPIYAHAMVDPDVDLPELDAQKGKLLTLGASEAVMVDYAEGIVHNRVELLYELGLSEATIVETETTLAEEIARFVTSPIVVPILLSIASLGLVVELYSPGFGVAGTMGLIALALFFYGHIIAGLAGMEAIILLIAGIVLIVLEFFVPGGIVGLIGVGAIITSLFMAGYSLGNMIVSIAIALVVAVVAAILLYRSIGLNKGILRHVILQDQTSSELGYVSTESRLDLMGLVGMTITPLRPAGKAMFNDERIDVVSDGSFIDANEQVKVIHVEGMRVVVTKYHQ